MATRTTTTRTTPAGFVPSADTYIAPHADFLLQLLFAAYFDCRKNKRGTDSALEFEMHMEQGLVELRDQLLAGTYRPGRSICFVVTHPKPREIWAADFCDRIVHHLLYNHIAPRFYASFIADSCACIPTRGTLYGSKRLEKKVRSITQNWTQPAYYLKCDISNFFVSIDKAIVRDLLAAKIPEPWWLQLAETILFHDPRDEYEYRGAPCLLDLVPEHKRLTSHPASKGLPIGNLSSQFLANVLMDVLDQFIKHRLRVRHYIRYVDDFILLHASAQQLNEWLAAIEAFLPARLGITLNPSKTILQPIDRGVDFVGQVIKPHRRTTRRRTVRQAIRRVGEVKRADLRQTANSYFGLFGQASHSHHDRIQLAKAVLRRGRPVNFGLTKTLGA